MKTTSSFVIALLCITTLSCDKQPSSSGTAESQFALLGSGDYVRTYYETVSAVHSGSQIPFILPPESLKQFIQYPESLSSKGIFAFEVIENTYSEHGDTLIVQDSELITNLSFELLNESQGNRVEPTYSGSSVIRFFRRGDRIYRSHSPNTSDMLCELPLTPGKSYSDGGVTFNVLEPLTIVTPAGSFATTRLEVDCAGPNGNMNYFSKETWYLNPDVGVVRYDLAYSTCLAHPLSIDSCWVVDQLVQRVLLSVRKI